AVVAVLDLERLVRGAQRSDLDDGAPFRAEADEDRQRQEQAEADDDRPQPERNPAIGALLHIAYDETVTTLRHAVSDLSLVLRGTYMESRTRANLEARALYHNHFTDRKLNQWPTKKMGIFW